MLKARDGIKELVGAPVFVNGYPVFVVQATCDRCGELKPVAEISSRDPYVAVYLCEKCLKHLGDVFTGLPVEGD